MRKSNGPLHYCDTIFYDPVLELKPISLVNDHYYNIVIYPKIKPSTDINSMIKSWKSKLSSIDMSIGIPRLKNYVKRIRTRNTAIRILKERIDRGTSIKKREVNELEKYVNKIDNSCSFINYQGLHYKISGIIRIWGRYVKARVMILKLKEIQRKFEDFHERVDYILDLN